MKPLLIATTNPGKFDEIHSFLSDIPVQLVSLNEAGISVRAPETGLTFEQNARMKAVFYQRISGITTLADDGGFEIDALGGEPGVRSHRWVSIRESENDDEQLIAYTMERLKGIPLNNRTARLTVVMALSLLDGPVYTAKASVEGIVPLVPSPRRTLGFPYRSLLYIPEIGKFYDHAELTWQETERYNHRKKAIEALKPKILEKLG